MKSILEKDTYKKSYLPVKYTYIIKEGDVGKCVIQVLQNSLKLGKFPSCTVGTLLVFSLCC